MPHDPARQFAPLADDYLRSRSHAAGRTLAMLLEGARPTPDDLVLDVATGAGHTAFAFASQARAVVALDLTPAMLGRALAEARARGLASVRGAVAAAERLPVRSAAFDIVTCRTAAHHFDDVARAVAEMRRALRPGGRLALTDQAAFDDPELRELQHRLEVLHDPTHRRNYTVAEWRQMLEAAGFRDIAVAGGLGARLTELDEGTSVADWCRRSRTAAEAEAEIRRLLASAPAAAQDALGVRGEGAGLRFNIYKLVAHARA